MYFRVPNLPMDTIRTTTLIQEMTTDGHSPLKFLCEDFNVYFAKYRTRASLNPLEIDCLFYEVVCCRLLQRLGIPTPELAIIEISSNSFSRDQLTMHRRHCRPGVLYLGSKEVKNADLIQAIAPISSRRDFKKFTNPYHLIGIAFFDLWVNNRDRGRSDNYNLLQQYSKQGRTFYAFDHAFCFGGVDQLRMFHAGLPLETQNRLHKSSYFKKFLPYLDKQKAKKIVDNFISLSSDELQLIISDAYDECPRAWEIPVTLPGRVTEFLTNQNRINTIQNTLWSALK